MPVHLSIISLINSIFVYLSPVDELFCAMTQSMTDALLISVWRPRLTELGPSWWRSLALSNDDASVLSRDGMRRGDFDRIGATWLGEWGVRKRTRFAEPCSGECGSLGLLVGSSLIEGSCKWCAFEDVDELTIGGSSIKEYVGMADLAILYFSSLGDKCELDWKNLFANDSIFSPK